MTLMLQTPLSNKSCRGQGDVPIGVERCGETPEGGEQAVITWRTERHRQSGGRRHLKSEIMRQSGEI